MNRRRFLRTALFGGAALCGAPSFIRRAFADTTCDVKSGSAGLAQLSSAYRRAQKSGQLLLVLVIPSSDEQKWDRGAAFGELLNHGSVEERAPLGLCEVVCARMADLRRLVPSAGGGEPLMVLVDGSRLPAVVRALDAALPQYQGLGYFSGDWQVRLKQEDATATQRIAVVAGLLRSAMVVDPAALGGSRAAQLAGDVDQRLLKQPVPGSRWAQGHGCGTTFEDDPSSPGFACGMGHVPDKSSRFLYFYAREPEKKAEK